jgi:hypothetical protein
VETWAGRVVGGVDLQNAPGWIQHETSSRSDREALQTGPSSGGH